MPELTDALRYTVIGMSMTFGAIGLLVLGMYLLTALARGREETPPAEPKPVKASVQVAPREERYRAAVAAVAVAVAQAHRVSDPGRAHGALSPWTSHVRREQLSSRAQRAHVASRPRRSIQ